MIDLILPPVALQERYGIFVGNCDTLHVERNAISTRRFFKFRFELSVIDGIRVFGFLGRLIVVRQNELRGCTIGVRFHAIQGRDPLDATEMNMRKQWLVADNMASNAATAVLVETPRPRMVREIENYA